jgi:hypothetical protein
MTSPEAGRLRTPASGLPPRYLPRVAAYARGPFIEPRLVTPTDVSWRNARTYVVTGYDGIEYRCVRVTVPGGHHFGWWAVELLGVSLMGDTTPGVPIVTPGLVVELADGRRIRLPDGWIELANRGIDD